MIMKSHLLERVINNNNNDEERLNEIHDFPSTHPNVDMWRGNVNRIDGLGGPLGITNNWMVVICFTLK